MSDGTTQQVKCPACGSEHVKATWCEPIGLRDCSMLGLLSRMGEVRGMNDDELIEMANTRYRVIRTGFWWRVRVGDGQQTVGRCYTETEAQRLAAALTTAFFDGAFASTRCTAEIGRNM